MNDHSVESLLAELEPPQFALGHVARLKTRLMRGDASQPALDVRQPTLACTRRAAHPRIRRPLFASWVAMAAMMVLALMLAVRWPTTGRGDFKSSQSVALPSTHPHEPVLFCVDLFPSRHQFETLDIRRWSSRSGVSR